MEPAERNREYYNWNKAVQRTLGWVEREEA